MEFAAELGIGSGGTETYPSQEFPTEDALIARYAAGDDLAFQPLCALLAPRIRAFFLRSFGDPALADSLVDATLARVRHGRESYRPEQSFTAWVFMLAGAVRHDELQRQSERALGAARAAIDALPEPQRAVLRLQLGEGLTFDQIAERLAATPEAIREAARGAYAQLQDELKNYVRSTNRPSGK